MATDKRITVGLYGHTPDDLELVEQELSLNTTDAIRKGITLLALMVKRQKEGYTPAFVRPDGTTQEIVFL
jgi:hypothetical protein